MSHKHIVLLNDREQEILGKLINQQGYRKQDIFRYRLRDLYRKEYPVYNEPKKKASSPFDKWTNEEYCEKILGGKVTESSRGNVCRLDKDDGWLDIPLKNVKKYNKDEVEKM